MRDVIDLLAQVRAALLGALADVSGDDWSRPTACSGWDVKDVLGHMVQGELDVGRVYRGEVTEQGYIDPEDGIARWRPLPGEAVRGALWQHGVATQRVLDAMDEATWRKPIRAFGCREMRQLMRLHLFEAAVHSHDLTDALGIEPVWQRSLDFLVEFVVRAAPPTLARHGLEPAGRLAVRVGDRSWVIDGTGDRWMVAPGHEAEAELRIAPATLVLAAAGRSEGFPAAEGDTEAARRITDSWRVV